MGPRVLVIGGGITGLAAAYALQQGLPAGSSVTLWEAASRWGGKIETLHEDGFVIEGGPDVFLTTKLRALGLCEELGLGARLVGTRKDLAQTYIVRRGALLPIPGGLTTFLPTRWKPFLETRLLSWAGKMRLGLEWMVPARRDGVEETLEGYFTRRLGREAYQWLVEPTLAGIYAGQGSQLSIAATFPQFVESERVHGSLTRAMYAVRASKGAPTSKLGLFASLQGGLGELVNTLVERLTTGGTIMGLGRRVMRLRKREQGGFEAHLVDAQGQPGTWQGEHVVLATPAHVSAALLCEQAPVLANELAALRYASTATLSFAVPTHAMTRPIDGHGFLVPRSEQSPLLACTWSSAKWHHRAPADTVLLRAYLGGAGRERDLEGSDAQLQALAYDELQRLMRFRAKPVRTWMHRWPQAMPQYEIGHQATVARVETLLADHQGLYLAGAAYRGLGIPDCIRDGERAAAAILARLRPPYQT